MKDKIAGNHLTLIFEGEYCTGIFTKVAETSAHVSAI
jgi:hypothetical protein